MKLGLIALVVGIALIAGAFLYERERRAASNANFSFRAANAELVKRLPPPAPRTPIPDNLPEEWRETFAVEMTAAVRRGYRALFGEDVTNRGFGELLLPFRVGYAGGG